MAKQRHRTPDEEVPAARDDLELQAILGVYTQAYEHLRHVQQMRATYFNFYIVAAGGAIAAVAALLSSDAPELSWRAYVVLGIVILVAGVLTTARIERWTGHVTHEIVTIRRLRALLRERWPALKAPLPGGEAELAGVAFDRPVWSLDRSIEPLACLLASLAGVAVALVAAPYPCWLRFTLGSLATACVLLEWEAEVRHQRKKHSVCCYGRPRNRETND